jgi:hypothetical protein
MTTNEKTESSATPAGATGAASTKTKTTDSAKAVARKQQKQQKNQKASLTTEKKKQLPSAKSIFEGIASGVNPMKGIVIAQGNGNLAGQFRVFQKKLAGAAADDKAYGLDSAILDLVAKIKSDFVKPKPDPQVHSKIVVIKEQDDKGVPTKTPTGEKKLVCFAPILKDEMEAEYTMDLKIQKSNWNQFEDHYEGYYRTATGNAGDIIMKYCCADKRMALIESSKDIIGFLLSLRYVCAQNNGAVKVDEEYQNLGTLHSACGYKQKKNVSNSKFSDKVNDRYGSAIFTSGKFTFGQAVYNKLLSNYGTGAPMAFTDYLQLPADKQVPIDDLVKERTVARLIVENSLNNRLREHLMTSYSTTKDECYPNTINDAGEVPLIAAFFDCVAEVRDSPNSLRIE